ncbi:type II toxin-antitoxin system HigB family toxin [Chitinophaga sp. sic0106]|uniref:type II toxin-antitoxin system HigB family toxin n=1 Tax=Chitinophaga sp. sic0106 TaxID=2854785 RepID=UPI001C449BBC|nr:type II toxin-antitoxin system HigB family toxin [Chitinophaga sp. sic0106]MBV7532721.1 type II toxin-antitoxin system HigB family toxin [Chitinophaga sp. sic0106]
MIHVIKTKSINDYVEKNQNSGKALWAWLSIIKSSQWQKPQDIVETFGAKAVDILPAWKNIVPQRAVIDIKGNHIRVIVKYQFHNRLKQARIYIKWIGTHAEYDKLCRYKWSIRG